MSGADGSSQEQVAGLRLTWNEAERRLYPLATTVPELYKVGVQLVRAVADGLSDVTDQDELVGRWAKRHEELAFAQLASGVELHPELSDEQVAGAAFALRDRELAVQQEAADRRGRVQAARAAGTAWAILHERGDVARGLANPYQCIDFHLISRLAIVSTVEQDPSTGGTNHVVSIVEMDSEGGEVLQVDVAGLDDRESGDAAVFKQNREELKALIEERLTLP